MTDVIKCLLCEEIEATQFSKNGDFFVHLTETHFKERLLKGTQNTSIIR